MTAVTKNDSPIERFEQAPVRISTEVDEAAAAIKSVQSGDTWRLLQRLLQ